MFAGTLSCFFMMHVNLRVDQKHSRIVYLFQGILLSFAH